MKVREGENRREEEDRGRKKREGQRERLIKNLMTESKTLILQHNIL